MLLGDLNNLQKNITFIIEGEKQQWNMWSRLNYSGMWNCVDWPVVSDILETLETTKSR
jgi:hypothetical protein